MLYVLLTAMALALSEQNVMRGWGVGADISPEGDGADASRLTRYDVLADEYALSPREREVLELLGQGRDLPHIQKELHISRGTAKTHAQHIYTKIGVHTRQELLDVLEQQEAGITRA
jgi:DNA-binding NarL/FixJ family response regulator